MKYTHFKKLLCIVTAAVLLAFTGCTTFDSFKTEFITGDDGSTKIVKIGVFEPTSGEDKSKAALEIEGIELAHSMYPTVDGKKVELIYSDNRSDIYAAETAIQDLLLKNPVAILGSYGNANSLVAGPYVDEANVPAMAITNTNPLVTSTSEYYFRACFVDTYQGTALARYAYSGLKAKKAGIIIPEGDEGASAIAQKFMKQFQKLTENQNAITVNEEFEPGSGDFTEQLDKIEAAGVKVVLIPVGIDDAENILKQAYERHMDVKFLGIDSWNGEELVSAIGKFAASKAVFTKVTEVQAAETETDALSEFMEAYQSKYGKDSVPDNATALGYDAYMILIKAIDQAGSSATGEQLKDQISSIQNYSGASGTISFNASGNPSKSMTIYTISIADGSSRAAYVVETDGSGKPVNQP